MRFAILLIFFLYIRGGFSQMDAPSTDMSFGDVITDVDEHGRLGAKTDKKVFSNTLFLYGQVRQTAEGTIKIMKNVADFALKAFDLLVRVENVVNTAIEIKRYVKEYKEIWQNTRGGNFWKTMRNVAKNTEKMVENTYINVINRGTDMMWLEASGAMNDLAQMDRQRQMIAQESRNVGALWNIEKDTVSKKDSIPVYNYTLKGDSLICDTTYEPYEIKAIYLTQAARDSVREAQKNAPTGFQKTLREQSYMAAQAVNMTDKRLIEKYKFDPRAKRAGAKSEVMSGAIASANVRKQQHADKYWELRYAIGMVSEGAGEESAITAQAQGEVLAAENDLKTTYSEHESLNDLIKVMGAMTLSNVGSLSETIFSKSAEVQNTGAWAVGCKEKAEKYPK